MNKIIQIFFVSLLLFSISCTNNSGHVTAERKLNFASMLDSPTEITFTESKFEFGTVKEGDLVKHVFEFENTGDNNLVLLEVKGSCGCTVPETWPREPIAPGEKGEIAVTFNSDKRVGKVLKSVRIEANTNPSVTRIDITGEVTK